MALETLPVGAAVAHDVGVALIAARAFVRVAADATGGATGAGACHGYADHAGVTLRAADRAMGPRRQNEADVVGLEARGRKLPGVVAGLTVGVEAGRHVIDGAQRGGVVVAPVAADASNRRPREGHVAQIAVAFTTGDHRVLAAERKAGAPVGVGPEQRALPALLVVTPLAMETQLATVSIAVAAAAGVGDPRLEVLAMAAGARQPRVELSQWEAGLLVIEPGRRPAGLEMTGSALGRRCRSRGRRLFGRTRNDRGRRERPARPDGDRQQGGGDDDAPPLHGSNPRKAP